jgi:hypothetical protein
MYVGGYRDFTVSTRGFIGLFVCVKATKSSLTAKHNVDLSKNPSTGTSLPFSFSDPLLGIHQLISFAS